MINAKNLVFQLLLIVTIFPLVSESLIAISVFSKSQTSKRIRVPFTPYWSVLEPFRLITSICGCTWTQFIISFCFIFLHTPITRSGTWLTVAQSTFAFHEIQNSHFNCVNLRLESVNDILNSFTLNIIMSYSTIFNWFIHRSQKNQFGEKERTVTLRNFE